MPMPPCLDSKRTWDAAREKLMRLKEGLTSLDPHGTDYPHALAAIAAQEKAVARAEEIYWDCVNSHQQ